MNIEDIKISLLELSRKKLPFLRVKVLRHRGALYHLFYYKNPNAELFFKLPLLAACRGHVVEVSDRGARLVANPFWKFFNIGEVEATEPKRLPRSRFVVAEKLDGSLIIAWRDSEGNLRFNTRGMLDMQTIVNNEVVDTPGRTSNPFVVRFINAVRRMGLWRDLEELVREGTTAMFELVLHDDHGRVVPAVAYDVFSTPEDSPRFKPYLLCMRRNDSAELQYVPEGTPFDTPRIYEFSSMDEVQKHVEKHGDMEGVVVYYPGHSYHPGYPMWNLLVKVKSLRYILAYQSAQLSAKSILRLILEEKIDDVAPLLKPDVKEHVNILQALVAEITSLVEKLQDALRKIAKVKGVDATVNIVKNNLKLGEITEHLLYGKATDTVYTLLSDTDNLKAMINKARNVKMRIEKAVKRLRLVQEFLV